MSIGIRLLGFLAILLAVFGGAVGVGRTVGPVDTEATEEHEPSPQAAGSNALPIKAFSGYKKTGRAFHQRGRVV